MARSDQPASGAPPRVTLKPASPAAATRSGGTMVRSGPVAGRNVMATVRLLPVPLAGTHRIWYCAGTPASAGKTATPPIPGVAVAVGVALEVAVGLGELVAVGVSVTVGVAVGVGL